MPALYQIILYVGVVFMVWLDSGERPVLDSLCWVYLCHQFAVWANPCLRHIVHLRGPADHSAESDLKSAWGWGARGGGGGGSQVHPPPTVGLVFPFFYLRSLLARRNFRGKFTAADIVRPSYRQPGRRIRRSLGFLSSVVGALLKSWQK
jgi:hypothetical protein